jgi:hypothetical protein
LLGITVVKKMYSLFIGASLIEASARRERAGDPRLQLLWGNQEAATLFLPILNTSAHYHIYLQNLAKRASYIKDSTKVYV